MAGDAQMPADDLDEVRVALGSPNGCHVANEPKQEARDPEAQTNAEGGCERARLSAARRPSGSARSGRDGVALQNPGYPYPSDHHAAAE